jgi:hypothetical protein
MHLQMLKTLDCPIVNPTLGGRANIKVFSLLIELMTKKLHFIN